MHELLVSLFDPFFGRWVKGFDWELIISVAVQNIEGDIFFVVLYLFDVVVKDLLHVLLPGYACLLPILYNILLIQKAFIKPIELFLYFLVYLLLLFQ